jgi:hypothetical protein
MRGRIHREFDYSTGMPRDCSESIRILRSLGWAVSVIKPDVVGSPMHRGRIEMEMIAAGCRRASELQTFTVKGRG